MARGRAQKELWKWMSRYVRLMETDEYGICRCVTCGRPGHPKAFDAGHCYPKGSPRYSGIEFDLRQVWPQCGHCNMRMQDKELIAIFEDRIRERYGPDVLDDLILHGRDRIDKTWVGMQTEAYKQMVGELLTEKGIEKWW